MGVEQRPPIRGIEISTAVLLGLVSVATAVGALQATAWSNSADTYGSNANDARDANITLVVTKSYEARIDSEAVFEARRLALAQDAAGADPLANLSFQTQISAQLGRTPTTLQDAWKTWRQQGFPDAANPLEAPGYQISVARDADSALAISRVAQDLSDAYKSKAAVLQQASLIDALALFLFGIAGINRLRAARIATLILGGVVFAVALVLTISAY